MPAVVSSVRPYTLTPEVEFAIVNVTIFYPACRKEEGWEHAPLANALMLASASRSQVIVLDAVDELPADLRMLVKSAIHVRTLQEAAVSERVGQLEQALSGLNRKGPRPVVKVLQGKPFVEVIREVLRSKIDLLVLPAGKKRAPGQPLFGSTEMPLIRKCPCPVWLVKPTRRQKYRRIMAAVDIDGEDAKKAALSSRIMEIAASFAHREGSELHIVHAWKLFGENTLSYRVGLSRDELAGLSRAFRSERRDWLAGLVEKHAPGTSPDRVHLVKGEAAQLIPEVAAREKIELIVMGTVSRTGLAGFFIGNTAETIFHHVDCSVLALKPQGFITPVRL